MQKITHTIFSFTTGGAEVMLVDILNEQVNYARVSLIIINDFYNKDLVRTIDNRVDIYFINRNPGSKNLLKIIRFNYLISQLQPDIIHCHHHNLINLIKYRGRAKICLTAHDTKMNLKYFPEYDKVFAISKSVYEDILNRSGIESTIIYNGIHLDRVMQRNSEIRADVFSMVQISRLNYRKKGQDTLLQALGILINERNLSHIQIDFIGDQVYDTDKEYLENITDKLNLKANVRFLGLKDRDYIYKNLRNYDLLVQPSHYEGFGLTIVEAMAAKIPVLVSDIEGPMEIIKNGKYGYYFKESDSLDCANKIQDIAYGTEKKIDVQFNFKYVYDHFDIKATAVNYLTEYKKLITQSTYA